MVGEKESEGAKRDGDVVKVCKRGGGERGRRGGREKEKRKKDGEGKEETSTVRACYFQSHFPFYCLLLSRNEKKGKVHTDFKKSHFLFDRCGVSFAV